MCGAVTYDIMWFISIMCQEVGLCTAILVALKWRWLRNLNRWAHFIVLLRAFIERTDIKQISFHSRARNGLSVSSSEQDVQRWQLRHGDHHQSLPQRKYSQGQRWFSSVTGRWLTFWVHGVAEELSDLWCELQSWVVTRLSSQTAS